MRRPSTGATEPRRRLIGPPPGCEAPCEESLASRLKAAGLTHVRGGVIGDGSIFDSERGPPGWELNDTPPGPVSGLQFNRGIVSHSPLGIQFAPDPSAFAAEGLRRALIAAKVAVDGARSSRGRSVQRNGTAPARQADRAPAQLADVRCAAPIAADRRRDGTLADRMRAAPARGRCRAKTGSHFSDVAREQASVLSGYCRTRGGRLIVFSIMMNRVPDVLVARRLQDRMVQAIAGYDA